MLYPDSRIMVFCKAPEPGKVKTRLAKNIGETAAATIHQHMAWHCLTQLAEADIAPVELWCSPTVEHDFFQRCSTEFGVMLKEQKGNNLGERMEYAFSTGLSNNNGVVVIGTDCPAINPDYLQSAFEMLENNDAVVGPAEDGGYVLLGLISRQPQIFQNMSWGTSGVLAETMSRLKGKVKKLPLMWDVDYVEDVVRLRDAADRLRLEKVFSVFLDGLEC